MCIQRTDQRTGLGGLVTSMSPTKLFQCIAIPLQESGAMFSYLTCRFVNYLLKPKRDLDIFYMRQLSFVPCNDVSLWYHCKQCIGNCETIATMVKRFLQQAGLENGKTNHSLRATGATQLFDAGVPQRIIQECTGHKSVFSLCSYERISHQ